MVVGLRGRCFSVLLFTTSSSDTALGNGYAEVFLDLACFFLVMMTMVQLLRIVVISFLLLIVGFLELSTCNHLVSNLLDVLELVLGDLGPRVGGYLGLGALPRLDCLHNLVLLSSLDVKFVIEGVGSSILL